MARLAWEDEAAAALGRVPLLVRPLARRKVEERVAAQGRHRVTLDDVRQAEEGFRALSAGKSGAELEAMLPAANRPGVEMTVLEACRGELAGCPHRLIDVDEWRRALGAWLGEDRVSERLRARVAGDQVLYHHKLRLSVCGCPNGCARPQIADLALVGMVRPLFDLAQCTACGACVEACPDQALAMGEGGPTWDGQACQGCRACAAACPAGCIGTSAPAARVLMGGKLGRHPRLAQVSGQASEPAQAVAQMAQALDQYIQTAQPGERFAAWRARRARE